MNNTPPMNIYIQKSATGGNTYETGCLICQGEGSGLINMVPLPTHRTVSTDLETGELIFNYICKSCVETPATIRLRSCGAKGDNEVFLCYFNLVCFLRLQGVTKS